MDYVDSLESIKRQTESDYEQKKHKQFLKQEKHEDEELPSEAEQLQAE
jgi:hypothetical protein